MKNTQYNTARSPIDRLRIERGTLDVFDAMEHWHYRAGRPATCSRVLRAIDPEDPFSRSDARSIVGVLVVSRPTLNGAWRKLAWQHFFNTTSKKENARRINTHLRCISRVVIDPRWRGIGLARTLVQTYLRDPETQATEAVAAMGYASPFFASAGMTEYRLQLTEPSARLLDACEHYGVSPVRLPEFIDANHPSAFVCRELVRWAGKRKLLHQSHSIMTIARLAAADLCAPPVAYAFTYPSAKRSQHGNEEEPIGRGQGSATPCATNTP